MIKELVTDYIRRNNLFEPEHQLIIGLSGGADSVALLLVLKELGYNVTAAHCNFHLRANESNRDQEFVEQLCAEQNIKLHLIHFDTYGYAESNKVSIEMAARELRYNWFDTLIKETKANFIAVGHHKDDNIETLLLNLARGAGLRGLSGIPPRNGKVVRPLLDISRKELEDYLTSKKQSYVTDSTNLEDEFARNKVRLNIIPQLEEINSGCRENIHRTINYLSEVELIYKQAIKESIGRIKKDNKIYADNLLQEVAPQTVLYEILYPLGFNSIQISDIFKACQQTETKLFSSTSYIVHINRGYILIEDNNQEIEQIEPTLTYTTQAYDSSFKISRNPKVATFDADKIDRKHLYIRKWKAGDWFIPFGMKGKKNISDYFTDCKFTKKEKDNQFLLMHKEDIIWVIGHRTDNRYRITNETKQAIIVKKAD